MPLNGEINVVSLIDVMMLLLIIFMLTAPLMQNGLEVDLPRVDARPVEARGGLEVTIRSANEIMVANTTLSLSGFKAAFPGLSSGKGAQGVTIMSDKSVTWDVLAQVWGVVQAAGFAIYMATVPGDGP